eukprot:GILJ01010747.1.p1 GENE.GILJ01010747.1~~GILJ01010747.1.p1  ORF type:complete len:139 (+),score=20.61 GILJ01010747.1:42-419(+)
MAGSTQESDRLRFQMELEFVQCLANPAYLNWLAQNRYFEDLKFLDYLKYLEYFRKPEYAKFIIYPNCLYILELLQHASVRNNLSKSSFTDYIHRLQFHQWAQFDARPPPPQAPAAEDQQQQQPAS